ncbi:hypothetical protein [Motilibacter deserti]|uniref:Uncharacterized protein n=1 Tax=Motilibacter deserti TaxID=2714956 RepID=A0ABX0GYV6_9ACTN|nr:hypothetical protein [Motilibacter deserti]NHC16197.1 hypothetical protein [Motilibacter deserti]
MTVDHPGPDDSDPGLARNAPFPVKTAVAVSLAGVALQTALTDYPGSDASGVTTALALAGLLAWLILRRSRVAWAVTCAFSTLGVLLSALQTPTLRSLALVGAYLLALGPLLAPPVRRHVAPEAFGDGASEDTPHGDRP